MKSIKRWVGLTFLWIFGWRPEGKPPAAPSYVLIAAPHTSNWDLPFMLAFSYVYDVPIRWAGKHTLFRFPFGIFMKALGGLSIVRNQNRNHVQSLADLFDTRPNLVLAVPAEGTRKYTERWKSGFYHVARLADVPIVCGYIDFSRKRGGFGPAIRATGNVVADMDKIRSFYSDKQGRFPEKFGPVRIRDESPTVGSSETAA